MRTILMTICFLALQSLQAQIVDKIDGIVDKNIILRSEVESQLQIERSQGNNAEGLECEIFDQMLMGKLLVAQAAIDSVVVSPEEVDSELDRKINYYISIIGGQKEFEEYYGKSVDQIKDDFRSDIKDQLVSQRMRQQIVGDVEITPSEVRAFFDKIPKDSLPYFNTEFELSQIVVTAKVSPEQNEIARKKLESYRERILNGESFEKFCQLYSEDKASLEDDCELGFQPRGTFVPEFEAVAWNLKEGELSDIVETQFGFHILQLVERKGELINIKHILVQPKTSPDDVKVAKIRLDSIREQLMTDSLTFFKAVKEYSDDKYSKDNGGVIISQRTGNTILTAEDIQPSSDYFVIDTMQVGQVSKPMLYKTQNGVNAYRIIKVDAKTPPHIANLDDDYDKIYEVAKNDKQAQVLENYIKKKARRTYIKIDERYKSCSTMAQWASE